MRLAGGVLTTGRSRGLDFVAGNTAWGGTLRTQRPGYGDHNGPGHHLWGAWGDLGDPHLPPHIRDVEYAVLFP